MQNLWRHICFSLALGLALVCYQPGLNGDFEFDDQANLLSNTGVQIEHLSWQALKLAALSGDSGPLGRPISMVSFAINHAFTGFDPYYLKLTNVVIHTLSGAVLYLLLVELLKGYRRLYSRELSDQTIAWIAIASSAAWLLHPLNITSVLYIVQRMTSLSGLFTLLALLFYAHGRNQILAQNKTGWWTILLAAPTAGLIAIFCKENAALLPLLAFLVEWFFFRFRTSWDSGRRLLQGSFLLILWLPLSIALLYLTIYPEWIVMGFEGRGFTLGERLLTESRVVWFYLRLILVPDISAMGIYHDDISISSNIFAPATTLPAVIGLLLLLVAAFGVRKRAPMLSFGILWFFAAHLIESSIIPLEIAHEHRNYLPMVGIVFAAFYYLLALAATTQTTKTRIFLAALLIAMLAFSLQVRATQWGDLLEHAIIEAENHPDSPRAQQQLGRMYFKLYRHEAREEFYQKALKCFQTSSALDPNFKSGLYARIILDYNAGRIPPDDVIAEFRFRLKHRRAEPGDVSMFHSLLNCQLSGDCKLPDQTFIDLVEIEVDRYATDPERQASFLSFLGNYAAQKMDNAPLAGEYLKRAVAADPADVQGRLNLAWFMAVTHQHTAAAEHISEARALDEASRKFAHRIEMVEKGIAQRRANPNANTLPQQGMQ